MAHNKVMRFKLVYENPFEMVAHLIDVANMGLDLEFASHEPAHDDDDSPYRPARDKTYPMQADTIPIISLIIGYNWEAYRKHLQEFHILAKTEEDFMVVKMKMHKPRLGSIKP